VLIHCKSGADRPSLVSFLPPPAHEIVGTNIGKEFQDILAVLLKIAVDVDDQFTGSLREPRFERAGLPVVSIEVERQNLRVLCFKAIQYFTASIAAPVVHEDDFERPGL